MPVRFQVDGVHISPTQRFPDLPVVSVEKPGFFRRVMRFGRGVVTGGRQLRGALMRLVNAKGTSAVIGLTSLSDTVSTPLSDRSSNSRYGLGIMRSRSDGLPTPTPSGYLENARRKLRLTLMASQPFRIKLDSPVVAQLDEANVQKPVSSVPAAKDLKRIHRHLYPVAGNSPVSEGNEGGQVKILGCEGIRIDVVSRYSNGTLYTITGPEGRRHSMARVSVEGDQCRQVLTNELNALRRIRALQGISNLDMVEEQEKDTYVLMEWMGDTPLMNLLHNDKCYDLRFTVRQVARLLHAIHCMHQCGVIHQSVSTRNIMTGGPDGNFTLFNFSSSVISPKGPTADGDIPLWVPDGKALGLIDHKRRARSPYYNDYVALGHIWHEMRTRQRPIYLGFGNYRVKEGILFTDEMLFIRRLLTTDIDYRFKSVEEIKRHAVFEDIDWQSFD